MFYLITVLIIISAFFEGMAYVRQIRKTLRRKNSKNISLKSYRDKLIKYAIALLALVLSHNWAGLALEINATILCIVSYIVIRRYR